LHLIFIDRTKVVLRFSIGDHIIIQESLERVSPGLFRDILYPRKHFKSENSCANYHQVLSRGHNPVYTNAENPDRPPDGILKGLLAFSSEHQ
jgi:hypothetical protein